MKTSLDELVACHECDQIHSRSPLSNRASAKCNRCGGPLYSEPKDSIQRALVLALTGSILFALANTYPFMYFKVQGRVEINTMLTGVIAIGERGMIPLAALICYTSIIAPGLKLFVMLYVLAPLYFGRVAPGAKFMFRIFSSVGPWGMLEVYMLGVLVAIVNLVSLATIVMGTAFYAFVALMIVTTSASACLDSHAVWNRLRRA